jgi:hypothetical protein
VQVAFPYARAGPPAHVGMGSWIWAGFCRDAPGARQIRRPPCSPPKGTAQDLDRSGGWTSVTGKRHHIIVTDGLQSYKRAFTDVFFDYKRYSRHVADAGLEESLNNSLERLNGTVREREKVMRGLKEEHTPIIPMNKIYYNFIRPHQGLEGKTPAEMAGVGVEGENKWEMLLRRSTRRKI